MIRLEPFGYRYNREKIEAWKDQIPPALLEEKEHSEFRMVRHDDIPCAFFRQCFHDDTVELAVWYAEGCDERRKLLAVICEKMIRRYHPAYLVIDEPLEELGPVYASNSFHPEGRIWKKTVEPWRKILNDRVFDDEGFIINQGMMKDIPFGWFDTKAKGCGWIAAWNLLKMLGQETTMERCAKELERGAFLGEMMGENLFKLYFWLKKQGVPVTMSLPSNTAARKKIAASSCGIILYSHTRGAHYVTYRNLGKGSVQIYNAVYGRRNHVMTSAAFMKQFTLFPTSVVIAVKQDP